MKQIAINTDHLQHATRDHPAEQPLADSLPEAKETMLHPRRAGNENASLYFVGTATTILEWEGIRLMTDPNFLHAGDHVHLGPGVTSTRLTNPAVDLHDLPRIDLICLSHYHEDHFDREVEQSLRRDLPIITTPHAKQHLVHNKPEAEAFTAVHALDFFDDLLINVESEAPGRTNQPAIKVTGMPGKHVPPGALGTLNDLVKAVPPTNGWMIELGYRTAGEKFESGYRIYISGDTLLVPELSEIPTRYVGRDVDLMLVHLGGTTIPSPSMPLLMVTMDAKQGVQLVRLINPDVTVPVHYDDYDVMLSPLEDFRREMKEAGLDDKVVYLDRGEEYRFRVRDGGW